MGRVHGKDLNYKYNTVDIEDELNSVNISFTVDSAEITSFLDAFANSLGGKVNVVTDIAGTLDMALNKGMATLFYTLGGSPVTTILDYTGGGPGANDPQYQCTASGLTGVLISSLTLDLPVGGIATYTASLQHSGVTTRATS